MRALTVQQPWAWAIIHGGKDVENRTQAWKYRGPLAIHAGARWSQRGGHDLRIANAHLVALRRQGWVPLDGEADTAANTARLGLTPPKGAGWFGALIGVVDLVDVHPDTGCCDPWGEHEYASRRQLVHLVLENPRPLPQPVPCKGRLGLWTPPADVLDELRAMDLSATP